MSGAYKNDKLQLKAMVNKGKKKVLFAEADSYFVDVLLSFLTLPLGKTLKILEREYRDKAPAIGRLSKLYRSLANLDGSQMEEAKKKALLDPTSYFEPEYKRLKLDITSSSSCGTGRYRCGGMYCADCLSYSINKDDGVFTLSGTSFVISDDLQIFPSETGLLGILRMIGITDMDGAETIQVEFGMSEIVSLLKASLTSSSPLTDVILNRGNSANVVLESQPKGLSVPITGGQSPFAFGNVGLKVTVQRSTGKVLNAQPKEDFMKVLYGIFSFRLGRAELLPGGTSFKAINSLYRSAAELIDDKYFKNGMKARLIRPDLPQDSGYSHTGLFYGQRSYLVMDDLTVMPFSVMSTVSAIKEQKIPISDVEEMVLQIGKKEALSIVKASLSSSTTILTDALMSHRPNKRVKRET